MRVSKQPTRVVLFEELILLFVMTSLIFDRAKTLRKKQTDAERMLWYKLRNRRLFNYRFKRQVPIFGKYIVDFLCPSQCLVVEIDGGQHAGQLNYDAHRTEWLVSFGYYVVRYWNHDELSRIDAVLEDIHFHLENPHPNPLPKRERGLKVSSPKREMG